MGKTGIIAEQASKAGKTVRDYLREILEREKSVGGAAKVIGVYPRAIEYHMRRQGLRLERRIIVIQD